MKSQRKTGGVGAFKDKNPGELRAPVMQGTHMSLAGEISTGHIRQARPCGGEAHSTDSRPDQLGIRLGNFSGCVALGKITHLL